MPWTPPGGVFRLSCRMRGRKTTLTTRNVVVEGVRIDENEQCVIVTGAAPWAHHDAGRTLAITRRGFGFHSADAIIALVVPTNTLGGEVGIESEELTHERWAARSRPTRNRKSRPSHTGRNRHPCTSPA